jgi:hypothetical protein
MGLSPSLRNRAASLGGPKRLTLRQFRKHFTLLMVTRDGTDPSFVEWNRIASRI